MSFKSWFGAFVGAGGSWLGFSILILIWIWSLVFDTPMSQILALYWFRRCKEYPRINYLVFCLAQKFAIWCGLPLNPDFGHWWRLKVPDGGFASWSLFWYGHWSLIHPYYEDCLSIFILKVHRTYTSFKSWFGALVGAGGSWLGFGILILILIWSLVIDTPIFRILALYLAFEVAKNIYVL